MYSIEKLQASVKRNQEGKLELNLSSKNLSTVPEAISKLTEVQVLDLSGNRRITQLPAELNKLENLSCLRLSGCVSLKSFAASQCFPAQLKELHVDRCGLTEVGTSIAELCGLETLNVSRNPIRRLPESVGTLMKLKELYCSDCQLTEVGTITELTGLEKLDLSDNPIKSIPNTISRLVGLKELTLRECGLTEMKSEITELTGLEKLDLSYNLIKSIPNTISRLVGLKELTLRECGLTEMKSEITELTGLEKLNLSWNSIKSIPNTISRLVGLKELSLQMCVLTEMKNEITELTSLEWLDLSENPIKSIPNGVDNLKKLKGLSLNGCKLQGVPESLFCMKSLKRLDLQDNQLSELPVGIVNLKDWLDYRRFSLKGNPMVLPPQNVCSRGSEAMFNFLQEYRQMTVHLKVVVVGSSMAGKTSLVKTLSSGIPTLVKEDDRTVVLDRSNWELCNKQCNVNTQIVDFGGQEWYRVIHPFFLDKDALILLVVNLGTYTRGNFDKDVGYWLHVLQSRVPKATVRFVLTQADRVDKEDVPLKIDEIQQLALQGECGDVLEHVRVVSSYTMENIQELQKEIVQLAVERGRKIPSSWLSLYREMCLSDDVKKKQFLVMQDVKKLMFKMLTEKTHNVVQRMLKTRNQRCRNVLSFLHSIGIVTWYDHPPELSNYVFHRPEYLAELLKAIFAEHHSDTGCLSYKHAAFNTRFSSISFEKEKERLLQQGVMSRALLKGLWEHMKLDEELFNGMMQLLVQFDLCYVLSSNEDGDVDKLMFPWFLKEGAGPEVNQVLQSVPALGCYRLTLEYLFVAMCPPPLYEKLTVRMHHHIQDTDSRRDWKDGVLARIFNSQVVVQRRTSGGEIVISIAVEGEDPVELWEVLLSLKEDMTSLMREWPGVKCERWLVCPHCVQSAVKPPHRFPGDYMEKKIPGRQLWMTCPRGGFDVPACLVYPVGEISTGSKYDIQHHLDLLSQFTCNLKKLCIPCEQSPDALVEQSANDSLPEEEVKVNSSSVPTANDSLPEEEVKVNSSSVPTLPILKELSKEIIPRWQFLGLQLGVSKTTIDNIAYNNVMFTSPEQKAFEMLKSWWDMGSTSTFGKLVDALRHEGLGRLADKYCCDT